MDIPDWLEPPSQWARGGVLSEHAVPPRPPPPRPAPYDPAGDASRGPRRGAAGKYFHETGGGDSVPLETLKARRRGGWGGCLSIKSLLLLFIIFILVSSDVFIDNIVAGFKKGAVGRTPTRYGTVLQGTFLVIFFAIALSLIKAGLI